MGGFDGEHSLNFGTPVARNCKPSKPTTNMLDLCMDMKRLDQEIRADMVVIGELPQRTG